MSTGAITVNEGTQSKILTDVAGGTEIGVVKIDTSPAGTFGSLWSGSVGVSIGTINTGTINAGTFSITGGTINSSIVTTGTINAGTINNGSIVVTAGTVSTGTINSGTINSATISGGTINLATISGNLGTIGTIGLATVSGNVGVSSGTINVSTISTLPNLPQGSINITAGTVSAGTLNTGTINTGTINLGTFVGKDANAAAQGGNPIGVGGTDSGGTIRTIKVDPGGLQRIGIDSGTISVLPNLPQGSINVTAGTMIVTTGTMNAGTINTGTINAGTINAGTLGTISNIGQLYNAGTVQNQLAGTLTALQNGTVYKGVAAPTAGSFTAAGTITIAGSQLDFAAFDAQGTWVGTVFTEGQIGTSSWFAIPYVSNLGVVGTSFTANGDYFVTMAGLDGVRTRLTYSSGTLTYNARQSNFVSPANYILGGSIGNIGTLNSGTVTVAQLPSPGSVLSDGENMPITSRVGAQLFGLSPTDGKGYRLISDNPGDGVAGNISLFTLSHVRVYNGTNWDRLRGDTGGLNAHLHPKPAVNILTFGTVSAGTIGTLVAAPGVGTSIYVTSFMLGGDTTTLGTPDLCISFGTQISGTAIIFRDGLVTNNPVAQNYTYPVNAGITNTALTWLQLGGAGTVSISIQYFIQ